MLCWKCQKETGSSLPECDSCSQGTLKFEKADDIGFDYEIDWDRLKTAEEFRAVVATLLSNVRITIRGDSPEYDKLRPWLRRKS